MSKENILFGIFTQMCFMYYKYLIRVFDIMFSAFFTFIKPIFSSYLLILVISDSSILLDFVKK